MMYGSSAFSSVFAITERSEMGLYNNNNIYLYSAISS